MQRHSARRNHATQEGFESENHLSEYQDRDGAWKASETSYRNRDEKSWQEPQGEVIMLKGKKVVKKEMHPKKEAALKGKAAKAAKKY